MEQLVPHQVPNKHTFAVNLLLLNNPIKILRILPENKNSFTCLYLFCSWTVGNILSRSQQASLGSIYDPFPQGHGPLRVHNSPGTVHSLLEHSSPATVFVHMFLCMCLNVSMYGSCVPTSCIMVRTCVPRVQMASLCMCICVCL